jgi:hypothetical protein
LVTKAEDAIARGELSPQPSQRQLRDLLNCRMSRAADVQRVLRQFRTE